MKMQESLFQEILSSERFQKIPLKKTEQLQVDHKDLLGKEIVVYKISHQEFAILVKTKVGYKGNFEGLLYHTFENIDKFIFMNDRRRYLNISDGGLFEELYIKKEISNQLMEVYFDLF